MIVVILDNRNGRVMVEDVLDTYLKDMYDGDMGNYVQGVYNSDCQWMEFDGTVYLKSGGQITVISD